MKKKKIKLGYFGLYIRYLDLYVWEKQKKMFVLFALSK